MAPPSRLVLVLPDFALLAKNQKKIVDSQGLSAFCVSFS